MEIFLFYKTGRSAEIKRELFNECVLLGLGNTLGCHSLGREHTHREPPLQTSSHLPSIAKIVKHAKSPRYKI
jgi:hypothetical protein